MRHREWSRVHFPADEHFRPGGIVGGQAAAKVLFDGLRTATVGDLFRRAFVCPEEDDLSGMRLQAGFLEKRRQSCSRPSGVAAQPVHRRIAVAAAFEAGHDLGSGTLFELVQRQFNRLVYKTADAESVGGWIHSGLTVMLHQVEVFGGREERRALERPRIEGTSTPSCRIEIGRDVGPRDHFLTLRQRR